MALPTFVVKAKNAVSKGKEALKKSREKSAGEEVTGTITGMVKGAALSILSTLALPIIIIVSVIIFVFVVWIIITAIPFIVFGVDLGGGEAGGNSTTVNYCNQDPSKAEYAYEPLEGGLAIPHYRQTDERWASDAMWDVDHGYWTTIGAYGCASAAFAMVASYLTDTSIYPDEVSESIGANQEGGMNAWQGDFYQASLNFNVTPPRHTNSWSEVKSAVENDQPVIVHYVGGSLFTKTGHFIVIRGKTSDGKFLVNDPSDNETGYKAGYINRQFTEEEMMQGFDWAVIFDAKVCTSASGIDYLQWAIDIANDDSHGYCQTPRTGPDYDCSSLVYYSLLNSGYSESQLGGSYPFTTFTMEGILTGIGFERHAYNASELQPGDILWRQEHTGMYVGDGQVVQASSSREGNGRCGQTGDQTGTEIWISQNTNNWTHYFRKTS